MRFRWLPGEGNGNPLQYSCLENSVNRGAWWATIHRVVQSQTQLSDIPHTHTHCYVLNMRANQNLQYSTGNSAWCSVVI